MPPPEKATAPRTRPSREQLAALRSFVRRYLRVLGAGDDLDDLIQETFLVLLQRPFEHRAPAATRAFLRRTARNLFLRRHRGRLPQVEAADEVWDRRCGEHDSGDGYVDALRDCMELLDGRARQLVDLTYRDGLGREQAACVLGMRPDGVKSALRRVRKVLADCIERRRER